MNTKKIIFIAYCSLLLALCVGCATFINNQVANALTGDGSSAVFTGDSDPQLVGDAIPFAIKMYEALLDANPRHQPLMLTTGSLFVMYANAFVHGPATMLPPEEWHAREAGMTRAKNLYLRGVAILYNALEARHRGFIEAAQQEDTMQTILTRFRKEDVPFMYWAAAGGLAAYSIDVLDFDLNARVSEWSALIHRAYELDPDFDGTALDELLLLFYASFPPTMGGDSERARYHFQRAQEKTDWTSIGAYIAYAEALCIPEQDYETFRDRLEMALAIDPDANPAARLVTIINQQKARWLLENAYLFFSFLPFPDDYW